jgi:hypothetical protein
MWPENDDLKNITYQKPLLVSITSCFDIDPNPKYIITRTNSTTACTDTLRKEVSSVASTRYSTNHNAIAEPINWHKKRERTEQQHKCLACIYTQGKLWSHVGPGGARWSKWSPVVLCDSNDAMVSDNLLCLFIFQDLLVPDMVNVPNVFNWYCRQSSWVVVIYIYIYSKCVYIAISFTALYNSYKPTQYMLSPDMSDYGCWECLIKKCWQYYHRFSVCVHLLSQNFCDNPL